MKRSNPSIAVVGGGGVGGYVAAKLSEAYEVDLISDSLEKLFLVEGGQKKEYFPTITKTPRKHYDALIFATKSYVLEEKAKKLLPYVDEKSVILPLLNGILPYEQLYAIFVKARVKKGAIYIIANRTAPNTVTVKGKGALIVAEEDPLLREIFDSAGLKYKMPADIDKAIWQKYLFIAATAALTTLYNADFGTIAKEHKEEFRNLLEEIVRIAQNEGVALGEEDVAKATELLEKSPPHSKTSMQLDFEAGGPTELDNLIGYLAPKSAKFEKIYKELLQRVSQ